MKTKKLIIAAVIGLFMLGSAFADGADPKTVTPAWVPKPACTAGSGSRTGPGRAPQPKSFNLFFIGYDYPILRAPRPPSYS
jgi:hypothetical protein